MRLHPYFLAFLLAGAVFPASSYGHARFAGSQPANGERLNAPPPSLTVTFEGQIERHFAYLTVTPEEGETVELEPEVRSDRRSGTLSASLPPLDTGSYRVWWSVVSRDGHRVEGRFTFQVE